MILPDGNLLVAFRWANHPNKAKADAFFAKNPKVVTCPITELTLVRVLMQLGLSANDADKVLKAFVEKSRSRLIPDDISATQIAGLNSGHRQTTDSYLAKLAERHSIKVATLDAPFANRFPEIVRLVD